MKFKGWQQQLNQYKTERETIQFSFVFFHESVLLLSDHHHHVHLDIDKYTYTTHVHKEVEKEEEEKETDLLLV